MPNPVELKSSDIAQLGEIAYADPWRLFKDSRITPYNPSDLVGKKGYRIYDAMRRDEQVKVALAFKKNSVISSGWLVKSPDGFDETWEPRVFVDEVLNKIECGMSCAIKSMLTMLDYGFSLTEKIWSERNGKLVISNLKTRKPHRINFLQDEFGNITGIQQQTQDREIEIPPQKVIVLTNENDFQNPYGIADLESAYRSYWAKDNTYKWLAMLLEKFGIPPVFALYNPDRYQGQLLTAFKDVLTSMQASTVALMPRKNKDDIELWSPSLADNVGNVFLPALDRYDRDIARAILIPNLLGVTPEETTGSQARARVVFDGFLFVIEQLRKQIEETINEHIVKQMVDINYGGQDYPVFMFIPISDDKRIGLLDIWTRLVTSGAVTRARSDEPHIRSILEFPEIDPEVDPGQSNGPIESLSQISIDYKQIERDLDAIEASFIQDAMGAIESRLLLFEKIIPSISISDVPEVSLKFGLLPIVRLMLDDSYQAGNDAVRGEIAVKFAARKQEFPKVKARDAIKAMKARALMTAVTINEDILKEIRRVLAGAIETGSTTQDTIAGMYAALKPWIGSDQLQDGKEIPAYRLEAIARTETTSAYNTGRLIAARDPELAEFIQGMRYDAVLDNRTSEVCRLLDGKIFMIGDSDLDALTPPNHPNCRSILTPMTISKNLDESDFITPSEVGEAKELASAGFAGPKSL